MVAGALTFCAGLYAAETTSTNANQSEGTQNAAGSQALAVMQTALALRSELAEAVAGGKEKPAAALAKLKVANLPFGVKLGGEAGFAFAAIDIGQRLLLRHPAAPSQAERVMSKLSTKAQRPSRLQVCHEKSGSSMRVRVIM